MHPMRLSGGREFVAKMTSYTRPRKVPGLQVIDHVPLLVGDVLAQLALVVAAA